MKLKDLLKEDNWKLDKGEIFFNNKRVGRYEFDRDADAFWIDNIDSNGQKGFDSKENAIQWLKKNKKAYLDRHNNSYHRKQRDYLSQFDYYDESVNEVSDTAYTIHRMTDAGQNAVQDFIDDNGLDAEKLLKYIKSNPQSKYDVRDYITGKKGTVGGDVKLRTRFIKMFKESVNEVKIHHMAREGALDNLKEVIHNIGPFSKEVVKHCEAAIKIIEKFDSDYKR